MADLNVSDSITTGENITLNIPGRYLIQLLTIVIPEDINISVVNPSPISLDFIVK